MSGIASIILTENNLSPTGLFDASTQKGPYNKFYLPLSSNLNGCKLALQKANIYYSWPNVSTSENNWQAGTISFPVGGSYVSFQWNLTAGYNYASISQLNDALQQFCIQNGLYLQNAGGTANIYFISLVANANSYGIDLNLAKIPTSGTGYTVPAGWVGFPTVSSTPRISFKKNFNLLIGYPASVVYDGGTSAINYSSSFTPQLSPVSSVLISCNLVHNPLGGSTSIMHVFSTKNTAYGSIIDISPTGELIWFDIKNASANYLEITFYDQNYKPLLIQDPASVIQLLIKN